MPGETTSIRKTIRRLRIDLNEPDEAGVPFGPPLAVLALAVAFVLVGGSGLDLGPVEARQAMAARAGFGPLGRVLGGWDPSLWPARLLPSVLWGWLEGEASPGVVRWPDALAAVGVGLILAHRAGRRLGPRAAVFAAACTFGSVAFIDRSAALGLDLVAGLAVVGALDRILGRGTDAVAGLWAALAFLAGGWPPLLMVLLPIVVLGRPGASLSKGLLGPPLLAFLAWSIWTFQVAPAEVWGAALALPLKKGTAWTLVPEVLALSLPFGPLAALVAGRGLRAGWTASSRSLVVGWLQVAGVAAIAGTLIPGLATVARVPALAGLALAASAVLDRAWVETLTPRARQVFVGVAGLMVTLWVAIATGGGFRLAAAVSHYRPLAVGLVVFALVLGLAAAAAVRSRRSRGLCVALVMVALGVKVAHWGYFAPEWNYRRSQGPWGRAIGQWVPPAWTLHVLEPYWPADLLYHTERNVRLVDDQELSILRAEEKSPERPMFFLMQPSEYAYWSGPLKLVKLRELEDERGRPRVIARTPGTMLKLKAEAGD